MSVNNKMLTEQEAVNPAVGGVVFGGSTLSPSRAVRSNVDRSFKVTWRNGTRTICAYIAGLDAPHSITSISTTNGSAISSASNLMVALY